jgi:hypothetical protein
MGLDAEITKKVHWIQPTSKGVPAKKLQAGSALGVSAQVPLSFVEVE